MISRAQWLQEANDRDSTFILMTSLAQIIKPIKYVKKVLNDVMNNDKMGLKFKLNKLRVTL